MSEQDYQAELEAIAREDQAQGGVEGEYLGGEGAPAQTVDPAEVELVAALAKMTGEMVAARRGEHWRLADREAMAWAEAAVPVIQKYAPDFKSSPELALVLCTGLLVLPRVQADRAAAAARSTAARRTAEAKQQQSGVADHAGECGYQFAQ